jgi:hypothetical protein
MASNLRLLIKAGVLPDTRKAFLEMVDSMTPESASELFDTVAELSASKDKKLAAAADELASYLADTEDFQSSLGAAADELYEKPTKPAGPRNKTPTTETEVNERVPETRAGDEKLLAEPPPGTNDAKPQQTASNWPPSPDSEEYQFLVEQFGEKQVKKLAKDRASWQENLNDLGFTPSKPADGGNMNAAREFLEDGDELVEAGVATPDESAPPPADPSAPAMDMSRLNAANFPPASPTPPPAMDMSRLSAPPPPSPMDMSRLNSANFPTPAPGPLPSAFDPGRMAAGQDVLRQLLQMRNSSVSTPMDMSRLTASPSLDDILGGGGAPPPRPQIGPDGHNYVPPWQRGFRHPSGYAGGAPKNTYTPTAETPKIEPGAPPPPTPNSRAAEFFKSIGSDYLTKPLASAKQFIIPAAVGAPVAYGLYKYATSQAPQDPNAAADLEERRRLARQRVEEAIGEMALPPVE